MSDYSPFLWEERARRNTVKTVKTSRNCQKRENKQDTFLNGPERFRPDSPKDGPQRCAELSTSSPKDGGQNAPHSPISPKDGGENTPRYARLSHINQGGDTPRYARLSHINQGGRAPLCASFSLL